MAKRPVVVNVSIKLCLEKRLVRVDGRVVGACDDLYITVAEATYEEVMKLRAARVIELIKPK